MLWPDLPSDSKALPDLMASVSYTAARLIEDPLSLANNAAQVPAAQEAPLLPEEPEEPPPTLCERYEAGKLVVDPQTNQLLPYWDILLVVLINLVAIRVPFQLGFLFVDEVSVHRKETPGSIFDTLVDIIFAFDMLLQFVVSFPDPVNHRWIRMPNFIVKQYLKRFFLLDFFSILPYGRIARSFRIQFGEEYKYLGVLKILSLLKLTRIARLLQRYDSRVGMPHVYTKLANLLALLCLSLHWIACSWGGVLSIQTIFGLHDGYTWGDTLRASKPAMFQENNEVRPFDLYTASLYWSCMTLTSIGYGDITASNTLECWAAILMMGACGIIWANIIGSICAIMGALDADNVAHENQMDSLNVMLEHFNMPGNDRMRLREFFTRRKVLNSRARQVELLHCMSPDLQGSVARHVQSSMLEKIWVFRNLTADGIVVGLFERFQFAMYPPKELVVLPGCFVCLRSGVGLLIAHVLQAGAYWGISDIVLHNRDLWENAKVLALSYQELQYLTRESFMGLLEEYPAEAKEVRRYGAWVAVKTAVKRKIVDEGLLAYRDANSSNGNRSNGAAQRSLMDSVKVCSVSTEKAEAKLGAVLDIIRSGHIGSEAGRQVEGKLDELLRTLSVVPPKAKQLEKGHERFKL